jgi:hypothetical protein
LQAPRKIKCIKEEVQSILLEIGEKIEFQYHRHHSVGIDFEFSIEDSDVIELVASENEYLHPEKLKPGWTGGDKERCSWVFQAKNLGETNLGIHKVFRGDVEHTCLFKVATRAKE